MSDKTIILHTFFCNLLLRILCRLDFGSRESVTELCMKGIPFMCRGAVTDTKFFMNTLRADLEPSWSNLALEGEALKL